MKILQGTNKHMSTINLHPYHKGMSFFRHAAKTAKHTHKFRTPNNKASYVM